MSNFLSTEEQLRRCSHDPNIEKLHKSYINNIKLASTHLMAVPSTANTPMFSSASVSSANTDYAHATNESQSAGAHASPAKTDNASGCSELDAEKNDTVSQEINRILNSRIMLILN
jgi:hypothetical protein